MTCLTDWKRPKTQSGGKWRSKVDWSLAEEYLRLDADPTTENRRADEEVMEKLKRRAIMNKHLTEMRSGQPAADDE